MNWITTNCVYDMSLCSKHNILACGTEAVCVADLGLEWKGLCKNSQQACLAEFDFSHSTLQECFEDQDYVTCGPPLPPAEYVMLS